MIEIAETRRLGLGAMTLDRRQTLIEQLVELKVIDQPMDAKDVFVEIEAEK